MGELKIEFCAEEGGEVVVREDQGTNKHFGTVSIFPTFIRNLESILRAFRYPVKDQRTIASLQIVINPEGNHQGILNTAEGVLHLSGV